MCIIFSAFLFEREGCIFLHAKETFHPVSIRIFSAVKAGEIASGGGQIFVAQSCLDL
jgi:hypothetical protein